MSMRDITGRERQVKFLGGVTIDQTPIAYIIVLAAVVTALSFIPLSVILGSGGSFPMSQAIYGLLGWVLGPLAGAVAAGIGALVGIFVAPHTSGVWPVTVYGAVLASFAAGLMIRGGARRYWWLVVEALATVSFLYFVGRAIFLNRITVSSALLATFVDWSSILLFALPTRGLIGRWMGSKNLALVAAGLALGTWISYGLAHVSQSAIVYHLYNWAEPVWVSLILVIPLEFITRAAVGTVIGVGVIAGLRAIGLVKPPHALY